MKRIIRCACAMLLAAALIGSTAAAGTAGLDWASGGYLNGNEELHFHMTASIESLVPYGDGTVEMLNALLQNMSVGVRLTDGGSCTELSFCVAGDPIVSLAEKETENGSVLTTSLLPRRTLFSTGSAMDALSGLEQEEAQFDLFEAIREAESCYQELTDAIRPYAEEKAASYSIKSVGTSRWSRIARLTPEQGAELLPLVARVLGCGMDEAFRSQLAGMTLQKGFIVGLYQTKEGGEDLAVYIKGNAVFPDGAQRAISYQWAFAVNDNGQRTDTYKFEMTKNQSPRDNREISASYRRSTENGVLLVDGSSKAAIRNPETNALVTTTITHDLSGAKGTVEGMYSRAVRTAVGETASTVTLTAEPQLKLTAVNGGAALSGTVHVEQLAGKNVHTSLDLLFDERAADDFINAAETGALFVVVDERLPQSSLTQNLDLLLEEPEEYLVGKPPVGYVDYPVPDAETEVNLDTASPAGKAAIMDEMSQNLAGQLLKAAARLPEEATALIRDNLSEADYAAFLELLEE